MFSTFEPHFLDGNLVIATLAHMTIFHTKCGIKKYPHDKQVLFTFPNVAWTTIFNKRNWNCDTVIVWEVVLPRNVDEGNEENEEISEDGEGKGEEEGHDA